MIIIPEERYRYNDRAHSPTYNPWWWNELGMRTGDVINYPLNYMGTGWRNYNTKEMESFINDINNNSILYNDFNSKYQFEIFMKDMQDFANDRTDGDIYKALDYFRSETGGYSNNFYKFLQNSQIVNTNYKPMKFAIDQNMSIPTTNDDANKIIPNSIENSKLTSTQYYEVHNSDEYNKAIETSKQLALKVNEVSNKLGASNIEKENIQKIIYAKGYNGAQQDPSNPNNQIINIINKDGKTETVSISKDAFNYCEDFLTNLQSANNQQSYWTTFLKEHPTISDTIEKIKGGDPLYIAGTAATGLLIGYGLYKIAKMWIDYKKKKALEATSESMSYYDNKYDMLNESYNNDYYNEDAILDELLEDTYFALDETIRSSIVSGLAKGLGGLKSARNAIKEKGLIGAAKSGASKAWEGTKSGASKAWEGTKSGASKAWEGTKSGASSAWEGIKQFGRDVNKYSNLSGTGSRSYLSDKIDTDKRIEALRQDPEKLARLKAKLHPSQQEENTPNSGSVGKSISRHNKSEKNRQEYDTRQLLRGEQSFLRGLRTPSNNSKPDDERFYRVGNKWVDLTTIRSINRHNNRRINHENIDYDEFIASLLFY